MSAEMGFGLTSVLTGNETLLDSNVLLEINCFLLIHGYYFNQNEREGWLETPGLVVDGG